MHLQRLRRNELGRRSHYRGAKRRKELKRMAKQEAKRRRRLEDGVETDDVALTLEDWIMALANILREGRVGTEGGPVAGAGVHVPFLVSREELDVLKVMEASAQTQWRETMTKVKDGDEVKVHYRGTLADGTEFDSSHEREPIGFTTGQGQVIQGFERAVVGMETGESQRVIIPCEEAYGERREDLVAQVRRSEVPENIELKTGLKLKLMQPDGGPAVVVVTGMDEETVTLDGNHPLAGQDLTFDITIVAVGS
jgi:peptidylprolyl isomerase